MPHFFSRLEGEYARAHLHCTQFYTHINTLLYSSIPGALQPLCNFIDNTEKGMSASNISPGKDLVISTALPSCSVFQDSSITAGEGKWGTWQQI